MIAQQGRSWVRDLLSFTVFFVVLVLPFGFSAIAEELFLNDVPDGHWAKDPVFKLIQAGVLTGFPDGTFRGNNLLTRYEIASMLSRFSGSFRLKYGREEKLVQELKSELALVKYKRDKAERETKIFGEFTSRGRLVTRSPYEGKSDYRLILGMEKVFDDETGVRIRLDTVDAGFNSTVTREIATRLIDVEGRFRLGGVDYKVNLGPGTITHTEALDFDPSENYTIYIRPKSAVTATKQIEKLTLSGAYVTRQVAASGKIGVHELYGKIGYDFGRFSAYLQPRYLFILNGETDKLIDLGVDYVLSKGFEADLLFSAGDFASGVSGIYTKVVGRLKDPWKTGTEITVRLDKVGSKYRHDIVDKYEFIYLNNFNRLILDGTFDAGLKVKQKLNEYFAFEWMGDYVTNGNYEYGEGYPGTYFIWQAGLDYYFSPELTASAYYRSYNVPSGTAQFGDAVPAASDIIGIKITRSF